MAERAQIELIIGPDGKIRFTTHGLKGQACVEETAALEKAVGRVVQRQKTAEAWQQAAGTKTGVRGR